MTDPVKSGRPKRRYDASGRRRTAAANRLRILDAARELFLANGYVATTVASIADRAGVATDTVYALVGAKAVVFRELVELALSSRAHPVPGAERDYTQRMREEPDSAGKLAIYAVAVADIQRRLAPLFLALREASAADEQLAAVWREITDRRAANMRLLAADLAAAGGLRGDLSLDEIADIIWTMNGSEYYAQLVIDRGWSVERFSEWLCDAWCRLLLDSGRKEGG